MTLVLRRVPSDRCVLLRGVFGADPEGPEDRVRRGHHRHSHPQEEGGAEEAAGPALHQLLPDHVMALLRRRRRRWVTQQTTVNQPNQP